jgi:hypothetical protein
MEPNDNKEEKTASKLPETTQLPELDGDSPNPQKTLEHSVTSQKDLNLTDEDKALDSGI